MATAELPVAEINYGRLGNNYMLVQGLQSSLSRSELNSNTVPGLVRRIIKEDAWKEFILPDDRIIRNPADFRRFIEGDRPEGCQTPLHVLRRMVADTDVADDVEQLLRGTPGNDASPRDATGRFSIPSPCDGMAEPDVIPFDAPAPRVRDYTRESKQGNSVGYTLRRLEKEAPELLAAVKAGDLSPNAAAVKAGFRDKAITVPSSPRKAARVLLRHFSGEALAELVDALSQGVEY